VLSMSELEMVDAAVGMGCELTIISLTQRTQDLSPAHFFTEKTSLTP
jgi:hypothetical protein